MREKEYELKHTIADLDCIKVEPAKTNSPTCFVELKWCRVCACEILFETVNATKVHRECVVTLKGIST